MNRRDAFRAGPALAVIALLFAACSSSAATPAPSSGAGPTLALPTIAIPSIAVPSIAVPSIAIPSIAVPSIAIPSIAVPSIAIPSDSLAIPSFALPSFSFPSEDKDLEGRLPNAINGITLTKYSFKGSTFLESGADNSQDLVNLLNSLGKTPNDLSVAIAADPSGDLDMSIGAFRVAGADSNALLQAFIAATRTSTPEDAITQANVGGKNVTQIVDPTDPSSGAIYVYPSGDVMFYVQSPDTALATTALQALP